MSASHDLEVVAGNVERFPADAVRHVVSGLRPAILARARRDTGGDLILSHSDQRTRLDLDARVDGRDIVVGELIPGPRRARGNWRILVDGTRPRVQGDGRHPGTKGKDTIGRAVDRALSGLEQEVELMWEDVTR